MNAVVTRATTLLFHLFVKVVVQQTPAAHRTLPVLHHSLQLFFVFLLRLFRQMLTTEEKLLRATIFELIEERAERLVTVATSAARLLIIRFERPGHLVVNDETNVRFVDAHAERIRRHDRLQL